MTDLHLATPTEFHKRKRDFKTTKWWLKGERAPPKQVCSNYSTPTTIDTRELFLALEGAIIILL